VTAPPVTEFDPARMCRDRLARLRVAMTEQQVDVLLLLGGSNAAYATSSAAPAADAGRALHERSAVVVTLDHEWPLVFTRFADALPSGWPTDRVRSHLDTDRAGDAATLVAALPAGRLALDDLTPALRAALGDRPLADASLVVGAAKIVKTPDELEGVRRAQAINEDAMRDVLDAVRPGVRTVELTALFLRRVLELGASHNVVDPVFQVMGRSVDDGPWSVTGDPVYPAPTTDRVLEAGDVVWVDTGLDYSTLSSDFGRTWIVGAEPDDHQREQFRRWRAVVDACLETIAPGATAGDLGRAARAAVGGETPWLSYFYLAHGTGTASAEMPLVGTDLGPDFDDGLVLEPGMVLVLEPVIWQEGHSGYRSEDIVAVTDTGYRMLSDFPYTPFAP
jgi:Xaa-Pro dipeptidase